VTHGAIGEAEQKRRAALEAAGPFVTDDPAEAPLAVPAFRNVGSAHVPSEQTSCGKGCQ
jgi:hypothetical protein